MTSMAAMTVHAVSDAEFAALVDALPVRPEAALAVAVSGGPDSMALLLLLRDLSLIHI